MRKALATFGMVIVLTLGISIAPTVAGLTTGGAVQVEQAAEAHDYYTCRQDFHSHNGWFIRYMGWFWKFDNVRGYSYQVYVHRHYLLKPVSEHYRQTRCS